MFVGNKNNLLDIPFKLELFKLLVKLNFTL